jgi:mRNA interferase MazF
VGLALFAPIISQVKGYPFEVAVPTGMAVSGVILADQIKTLDWRARRVEFIGSLSQSTVLAALKRARMLLE